MRAEFLTLAAGGAAAALLLTAAQRPTALAQASPGLWEISGAPGSRTIRECVADVAALGRFEHRGRSCKSDVVRSNGSLTVLTYDCRGRGFGRSEISMITPRNLRIGTQGISDNMPFNYVLQARRIGDCPAKTSPAAH